MARDTWCARFANLGLGAVAAALHSDPLDGGLPFQPWQLLSYGFLHFEFWHLFANMFALYMFGPDIEHLLGSRRFCLGTTWCAWRARPGRSCW